MNDHWPEADLNSKRSYDVAIEAMRERLEKFRCERIGPHQLFLGDCREIMPLIGQVHSCVTDPPYHLTSIVKRFANTSLDGEGTNERRAAARADGMARFARGFMGQTWDGGDISFNRETWKLVYSTLLPGSHLVSFAGTRTYHRIASAIDDAGFEVRDMCAWLFGSGFPKSHDISKAIDRAADAEREVVGLKKNHKGDSGPQTYAALGEFKQTRFSEVTSPATEAAKQWEGWGTALKPALEPICLARKPLAGKTVAQNVLEHGTGAINVDGCRIKSGDDHAAKCASAAGLASAETNVTYSVGDGKAREDSWSPLGRWPANVLHDSSIELLECFAPSDRPSIRFFYSPKASAEEREEGLEDAIKRRAHGASATLDGSMLTGSGNERTTTRANHHPTVKPVDLMAWLVRLITPPKGIVLDPFMGSGSTGIGAVRQNFHFRFIGIEQNEEYFEIACRRIRAAYEKPDLFIEQPKPKPIQETLDFDEAVA